MTIESIRTRIKSGVWQAVAQSGVEFNKLTTDEQNRLVDAITDHMLIVMNEALDSVPGHAEKVQALHPGAIPGGGLADLDDIQTAQTGEDAGAEKILWEGRPFLSLVEFYTITDERIKVVRGFLGRAVENYELIRVQDIDVKQAMSERMLGVGDVEIRGADPSQSSLVLRNVTDPQGVYELLRRAWLNARKRHGLLFREEM